MRAKFSFQLKGIKQVTVKILYIIKSISSSYEIYLFSYVYMYFHKIKKPI